MDGLWHYEDFVYDINELNVYRVSHRRLYIAEHLDGYHKTHLGACLYGAQTDLQFCLRFLGPTRQERGTHWYCKEP